jgi:uncharacterized protein YdhG (YjbR/CyaY superfamily)
MANTDFHTVDGYLATKAAPVRAVLERVRSAIRKALPGAEEGISYQIPAFRSPGGVVLFFAGWKEHFSIYPASERVVELLRDELASYEISKGTIRFPYSRRVPVRLIAGIAKIRAKEVDERVATKRATKPRKRKARRRP